MPPPVTPASKLKRETQTPNTGLDLRASMTPYETPSRRRSRVDQPIKRALEREKDDESPPKRQATPNSGKKRLESVTSAYMLDVAGISPIPTFINGSDYPYHSSDSAAPASES